MKSEKTIVKRMLTLSSILLIGLMSLTACSGSGGLNITGGGSESGGAGIDQTTLILIVVGVIVLIVVALARRK